MTNATADNLDVDYRDAVWRDWLAAATRPGIGAVIALTIVGGIMRFIRLEHPPLLFDEAATYTRVVGSFRELIEILRYDGFAPLHYELYWAMGKVVTLTPFMMRLVPAIAGTLMIPAMYFLARQVASRRVATLAAAATAFSAFLHVYSRDAKMYMHLWLFGTLCIACLLWWMRPTSGRAGRVAWLGFVAAGCAMNGLHALGLSVSGVALLIVLTHPLLTKRKLLLALVGLLISTAGVGGHYALFNRWGKQIQEAGWRKSGLEWVGQRNARFSKPVLLWDTASSWLLAYRSPRPPIEPPNRVIVPVVIVSSGLGALLVAGMFPWPARVRDDDPHDAPPEAARGRGALWMAMWLLLPCAGFYVVSFVVGRDVWTARYLGVVVPPLFVLVALLIQRLPLPALRAGATALLIGANLLQYGLHVTVESGIPVDQIVADLADANDQTRTVVAVKEDITATSLGGGGGIFDYPGRYYLSLATGRKHPPLALRNEPARRLFDVPTDVRAVPKSVSRLTVWADGARVEAKADPVLKSLGAAWTRRSSEEHAVRDFWCWRRMFRCTRSVYVRATD